MRSDRGAARTLICVVIAIAATLGFAKLIGADFMGQIFGDRREYHTDYFIVFVVAYLVARYGIFGFVMTVLLERKRKDK